MDIRQLKYFVRVAELGSFSKAAAFLKIAQPALSRQIRNLELEHKEALLIRNGRGVEPTDAGNRLLEHARGMLRLMDRAYEDMENSRTGKLGRVTIGMPATLSVIIATPLVRKLREHMPDAKITLAHGRSSQLQEWLLGGTLDMALVLDAPATPMLEIHPISVDSLGLMGTMEMLGSTDPIPMRDLAHIPMIIQSRPNKIRVMVDTVLAQVGEQMEVVLESDSHETSFHMAQEGMGATIHTMRFQRSIPAAADLVFRRIVEPEVVMKSQIILPARRPISRLQDEAFDIFRDICRTLLREPNAGS
ncbi:LysR family transcriptional regulator [Devosia sp. Root635]|uniref:LysR family transcriptional regulator n=1 Tax=Devosia sp. Root635 TaxID=1736575 RepID=UPI0006F704A4|nr:LysR substrate-binding domain-containing protein [Devosia sp. Root635]KRA44858.1 transcriptional regulator [Devosia sp. Root635]